MSPLQPFPPSDTQPLEEENTGTQRFSLSPPPYLSQKSSKTELEEDGDRAAADEGATSSHGEGPTAEEKKAFFEKLNIEAGMDPMTSEEYLRFCQEWCPANLFRIVYADDGTAMGMVRANATAPQLTRAMNERPPAENDNKNDDGKDETNGKGDDEKAEDKPALKRQKTLLSPE